MTTFGAFGAFLVHFGAYVFRVQLFVNAKKQCFELGKLAAAKILSLRLP